ncbi:MAG: hypothetical protein JJT94_01290 [Bernardetiaceae bacterium]|nr:hypothetical protein [Bernardetiaceae bacterium]
MRINNIFYRSVLIFLWIIPLYSLKAQKDDLTLRAEALLDSIEQQLRPEALNAQIVNYDANVLHTQDNQTLANFFEALYSLQKNNNRKVNILHIGDSHLQADFFSGQVRRQLQEIYGDGGRGFIFPYTAAGTNNPTDYKVSVTGAWTGKKMISKKDFSRWGIAGITAVATQPNATITIQPRKFRELMPSPITSVKVFYPVADPRSYSASLLCETTEIASQRISPFGFYEVKFKQPQTEVHIGLDKSAPTQEYFIMQGIMLENDQPGIVYNTVGVNGAEFISYFRCEDFERHIRAINPDLVIVSLGTNDAYVTNFDEELFQSNIEFMLGKIKAGAPKSSIIFTTPNDVYRYKRYPNYHTEKVCKHIKALAKDRNLGFWDFYEIMGGFKSIRTWQREKLAQADLVHLTISGYELQGELFFNALQQAYYDFLIHKKENLEQKQKRNP